MKQKATLTLTHVTDPVTGTGKNGEWSKRTFVFTTGTDTLPIVAWNYNHELPPIGRAYDVEFSIKGREYNGNYYTDLTLDNIDMPQPPAQPQPQQATIPGGSVRDQAVQRSQQRTAQLAAEQVNDLPF